MRQRTRDPDLERAVSWLVSRQRTDGGWTYYAGEMAFVEPTAAGLLALLASGVDDQQTAEAVRRAAGFLCATQRPDGAWGAFAGDPDASWASAWAAWGLALAAESHPDFGVASAVTRALDWLLAPLHNEYSQEEIESTKRRLRLDANLVGWPWLEGDAQWVFPTSISIIASAAGGRREEQRVRQGVRFLADRVCKDGGWNFGNPFMIDKYLHSDPIETAAALLALVAAGEELAAIRRERRDAVSVLISSGKEPSPITAAWVGMATRVLDLPNDEQREVLLSTQEADGSWQSSPYVTALAILGLSMRSDLLGA